jgi:hypothetical protein
MSIWMQHTLSREREKQRHEAVAAIEGVVSDDDNKHGIEVWLQTPQAKALIARNILNVSIETFEEAPSGVEPKLQSKRLNTGMVREEPAG